MKIKIFITGGTFDKEYNDLDGQLYFKKTHVPEILELGRSRIDIDLETLMMIDSLDMTEEDREKIAQNCLEATQDHIVITHGTDTMVETAKVLAKKIKNEQSSLSDKTIVLTGAMVPYVFRSSDGLFNFGAALAFAQTLPAGVYIAMNGRYFNWDNAKKNKEIGEFETLQ